MGLVARMVIHLGPFRGAVYNAVDGQGADAAAVLDLHGLRAHTAVWEHRGHGHSSLQLVANVHIIAQERQNTHVWVLTTLTSRSVPIIT